MVISYAAKMILIRQSFYDAYCVVASKCLTVVHAKVFTLLRKRVIFHSA